MKKIVEKIFKCLSPVPVVAFIFWKMTDFWGGEFYSEIYFLSITLSISISFSYIYFNIEGYRNKLICFITSFFHGYLFISYIYSWIFKGEPITYYTTGLLIGIGAAIIKIIYDAVKHYVKY